MHRQFAGQTITSSETGVNEVGVAIAQDVWAATQLSIAQKYRGMVAECFAIEAPPFDTASGQSGHVTHRQFCTIPKQQIQIARAMPI
jgi:hypothetical protein